MPVLYLNDRELKALFEHLDGSPDDTICKLCERLVMVDQNQTRNRQPVLTTRKGVETL